MLLVTRPHPMAAGTTSKIIQTDLPKNFIPISEIPSTGRIGTTIIVRRQAKQGLTEDEYIRTLTARVEYSFTTNDMYRKINYGEDGKFYVRLRLSQLSTLWRILSQQAIERGDVIGYFPPTASDADLAFFEWHLNSRIDMEARSVDYEYKNRERDFIAELLFSGTAGQLGIFYGATVTAEMMPRTVDMEDVVATYYHVRTAAYNKNPATPIATETYYVVEGNLARDRLDYVLDNVVERLPFLGVVTSLPRKSLPDDKTFDLSHLTVLAANATAIIVGAYGRDANLIWRRKE